MAAVLVHIDLDDERPHPSSLQALAAGRTIASSWGATLYAALIAQAPARSPGPWSGAAMQRMPGNRKTIEAIRITLVRGGADKIVVALIDGPVVPLWSALGTAWQGVLDHLRPRLVLFGADAPSAIELGPRTGARIGARLVLRARPMQPSNASGTAGTADLELRDRDGSYIRMTDGGAAVCLIGAAPGPGAGAGPGPRSRPRIDVPDVPGAHGDDDIDVMMLELPGGGDPRIELAGTAPAELAHLTGTMIAIGDAAAGDPEIVQATARLAKALGAHVVGSAAAAATGVVGTGAIVERGAALTPELCIAIGAPSIDVAGSASLIRIGTAGGKGVDGALTGSVAENLVELAHALEAR
ncbi:MAG TPA: hypothetical protein VH165_04900 [Kofleriaceae bacterium]|nr:hypothetical protein [Kofleriaceae bacterium]